MPWITPSLLSADPVRLLDCIRKMEEAGARILHLDVMDGHFVPNLTFGLPVLKAIRRHTNLLLDVHLMISNPEEMAEQFVDAGADFLTVHIETVTHLDSLLERMRSRGARPGVALNPHSSTLLLEEILEACHHVLVMSVNPGFGGQEFILRSLEKVKKLRAMLQARGLQVKIEIDGGVGAENIAAIVKTGADLVVVGSSIFATPDPVAAFRTLQELADEAEKKFEEELRKNETFSV